MKTRRRLPQRHRTWCWGLVLVGISCLAGLTCLAGGEEANAAEPQPADSSPAKAAVPLRGAPFAAQLREIDKQGQISFITGGEQLVVATADLVRWGQFHENKTAPHIVFADGSLLVADVLEFDAKSIIVESAFWPAITIARKLLAGVIFSPPAKSSSRDQLLQQVLRARKENDLTLLKNGDQLSGLTTAAAADSALRDEFGLRIFGVASRVGREPVTVEVDDTLAVIFADVKPRPDPTTRFTWVGTRDGSLLAVSSFERQSTDIRLTLSGDLPITLPAEDLWPEVSFLQSAGTSVRYLSDLSPIGYLHSPYLELKRNLGRDRSVLGTRLRRDGAIHLKGLGMPATSRVVYQLAETDRRFSAELALDDVAGELGSVVFRVYLEKQTNGQDAAWQAAYTSPVVRGHDSPLPVSLDLTGAKSIALIVDFADRGDECDFANWLNARFSR